jgi:hypothetical protein
MSFPRPSIFVAKLRPSCAPFTRTALTAKYRQKSMKESSNSRNTPTTKVNSTTVAPDSLFARRVRTHESRVGK